MSEEIHLVTELAIILIAAGVFYYVFNFIVAWSMERLEKHYSYYN